MGSPAIILKLWALAWYAPSHSNSSFRIIMCLTLGKYHELPLYLRKARAIIPIIFAPLRISILCWLMDRILHEQIKHYILANNLLTPSQHGLHKGRSTSSNLLESVTDWIFSIYAHDNIDVLYIDLTKAFDSVVHSKLLLKLSWLGISGDLLSCITCFLSNRKQRKIVEGASSPLIEVTSGVPQGSVLGSLLFLMFVNDLFHYLSFNNFLTFSPVKLFADDIKAYWHVNTLSDAIFFQAIINSIVDWCHLWQLAINPSKCQILHLGKANLPYSYDISNKVLPDPVLALDLGVQIDNNLTLFPHISTIAFLQFITLLVDIAYFAYLTSLAYLANFAYFANFTYFVVIAYFAYLAFPHTSRTSHTS